MCAWIVSTTKRYAADPAILSSSALRDFRNILLIVSSFLYGFRLRPKQFIFIFWNVPLRIPFDNQAFLQKFHKNLTIVSDWEQFSNLLRVLTRASTTTFKIMIMQYSGKRRQLIEFLDESTCTESDECTLYTGTTTLGLSCTCSPARAT